MSITANVRFAGDDSFAFAMKVAALRRLGYIVKLAGNQSNSNKSRSAKI